MRWKRMKKVAILPNVQKDKGLAVTKRLVNYLLEKGCEPQLSQEVAALAGLPQYAKEEAELLTYVLNQTLTGIPIEEITKERFDIVRRAAGMTALLKPIGEFLEDLLEELSTQKLYLQGASKLLSQPEYRDVAKAQALLDYIGDSSHVPALRRFTREIDGVRITIGPENGAEPLENASMVYATYNIGTVGRGLIGIVGPTRMDYGRLSARLSLFSKGLNKLIAATFFDELEDDQE